MLAREEVWDVETDTFSASKASGVNTKTWPFDDKSVGVLWLLEPRRSPRVDKWSGTLTQPAQVMSKNAATMSAFAHFSLVLSEYTTVYVDLQSEYNAVDATRRPC